MKNSVNNSVNNETSNKTMASAAGENLPPVAPTTGTNSPKTLSVSAPVAALLADYANNPSGYVQLPEGILKPDVVAEFGPDGTTSQVVAYDLSQARNATVIAKTEKNNGKRVGAVIAAFTMGQKSGLCRLSLSDVASIVNSGNPKWNTVVTFGEKDGNAKFYSNFSVNSPA